MLICKKKKKSKAKQKKEKSTHTHTYRKQQKNKKREQALLVETGTQRRRSLKSSATEIKRKDENGQKKKSR